MFVGHFAGHADVVADVADVGGGEHHIPVLVAVAGPAVELVHGPVSGLGGFGVTREVEALEVAFAPGFGEDELGFIEDDEGAPGCLLEPCAHAFHVGLLLKVEVDDVDAFRQIRHDLQHTLQGESAHVGDDQPILFECWHGVVLNGVGSLVRTVGAVVDFDRHD